MISVLPKLLRKSSQFKGWAWMPCCVTIARLLRLQLVFNLGLRRRPIAAQSCRRTGSKHGHTDTAAAPRTPPSCMVAAVSSGTPRK